MDKADGTHKIIILKGKRDSLIPVEQYLAHRDWEVLSTSSLKTAIGALIKDRPEAILIAVDHPNKKVKLLPPLIQQALKIRVIAFIESSSTMAMQSLNELKLDYVLFPPVSGPSIERLMARIKKDEQRTAELAARETAKKEAKAAADIAAGKTPDEDDTSIFPKIYHHPSQGPSHVHIAGDRSKQESPGEFTSAESLLRQFLHENAGPEEEEDPIHIKVDKTQGFEFNHTPDADEPSQTKLSNAGHSSLQKPVRKVFTGEPLSPKINDYDSILVKGTQEAIDESILKIEELAEYEALTQAASVACITVDSPRFSGYLVAAMGENRKIDQSFIEAVKLRLVDFLRKHGETVKEEDKGMDLKIEQVDFEGWALEHAEFLRKTVHGENELAMAFFPNPNTQKRLEQSAQENMLQMDLSDLKDDIPVEFDTYIYMPTNNKYILYTPQGRKFASSQKSRLTDKGVDKIHLRKESEGQVKKYRAQIFLNEKILEYKKNLKKKTGS